MPAQADKEFAGIIGGRTVKDKPELDNEPKKPGFAQQILEDQKEALRVRAVQDTLGIGATSGGKPDLATQIVTKSMETTDKAVGRLQEETEKLRQELIGAQKLAQENMNALYTERLARIGEAQQRMELAAQRAAEAGAPKDAFATYKEVQSAFEGFLSNQPQPQVAPRGMSDEVAITLKKMELEQARMLLELQQSAEVSRREFDLKLKQLEVDHSYKLLEHKDKMDTRRTGIETFQDLAQSVGKAVRSERETAEVAQGVKAAITSFPCQLCGTAIPMPEDGGEIKCPKAGCGATYSITI